VLASHQHDGEVDMRACDFDGAQGNLGTRAIVYQLCGKGRKLSFDPLWIKEHLSQHTRLDWYQIEFQQLGGQTVKEIPQAPRLVEASAHAPSQGLWNTPRWLLGHG